MSVQQTAVTNPFKVAKEAPNLDSYVDTTPVVEAEELLVEEFEQENENEAAERSSSIQSGWAAAKKAVAKSSKTFATDFRFDEDVQLIKFISSDPLSFMQHWVNQA